MAGPFTTTSSTTAQQQQYLDGGNRPFSADVFVENTEIDAPGEVQSYSEGIIGGDMAQASAPASVSNPVAEVTTTSLPQAQAQHTQQTTTQQQTTAKPAAQAPQTELKPATTRVQQVSTAAGGPVETTRRESGYDNSIEVPASLTRTQSATVAQRAVQPQQATVKVEEQNVKRLDKPEIPENYVEPPKKAPKEEKPSIWQKMRGIRKRSQKAVKAEKAKVKNEVHQKNSGLVSGNDIVTQLVAGAEANLSIEDVSIGSNVLLEDVRQPGNILLERVNAYATQQNARPDSVRKEDYLKDNWTVEDFTGDVAVTNIKLLAKQINRSNIWVTMSKSPTSEPESYQSRRLRVHSGDGIKLHPLAVKSFNADFDGDGASIHLDGKNIKFARRASEYIIGTDGTPKLDENLFFKLYNGKNREQIVDMFEQNITTDRNLIDVYIAYCEGTIDFQEFIESIADLNANDSRQTRNFIDRFYKASLVVKRNQVSDRLETSGFVADSTKVIGRDLNKAEAAVYKIMEEAKQGQMPPNYQQFVAENAFFVGDVAGKNAQFRLGANISKQIKRSAKTYVGEEGLYDLWLSTATAALSKAMNARVYSGEKQLSANEWLRNAIFTECGFPADADNLKNWAVKFAKSWNRNVSVLNAARVGYTTSWSPIEAKVEESIKVTKDGLVKLDKFSKAFLKVYGDFTVGKIFGDELAFAGRKDDNKDAKVYDSWNNGKFILYKYKHTKLRKFAGNNNVRIFGNVRSNYVMNGPNGYAELLMAIADTKNGSASKFNRTLAGSMESLQSLLDNINNGYHPNSIHAFRYEEAAQDAIEVVRTTQPEMFSFFNMEDPAAFISSEYGQKIINAKSAEELLSIRTAMIYEWRVDKLRRIQARKREAAPELYGEYKEKLAHAQAVLASSSDAWSMILKEMRSGSKNFKDYIESGCVIPVKRFDGSNVRSQALELGFRTALEHGSWSTIKDFLTDTSVPGTMKYAVIADMVVYDGGPINTIPDTIAYQLEADPAQAYAGLNTNGYQENQGNPVAGSKDSFDRINKTLTDSDEDTSKWEEYAREYESGERDRVYIPTEIYLDAVLSPMEKDSNDSEKAHQTAMVNAFYNSIATALDGGHTTELRTVDSGVFGIMSHEDITRHELIDIATNNDVVFFDEAGRPCRASVLPGRFEAMSPAMVGVTDNTEGGITLKRATPKNDWAIPKKNLVPIELMNKPGFGAMVALFTPMTGKNLPNARRDAMKTTRTLLDILSGIANTKARLDIAGTKLAKRLNSMDADKINYGLGNLAMNLGDEVANMLIEYSQYVEPKSIDVMAKIEELEFDRASVNCFYDTRQTLSGAKTQVSTGIEGNETERHKVIESYFMSQSDVYRNSIDLSEEDQQKLVGAPTSLGIPYEPGMECIVYDADGITDDPTLASGQQMSSISRFFSEKRSYSGEAHNLKAKKTGDDGKDAIVKNRRSRETLLDGQTFAQDILSDWMQHSEEPGYIEKIRADVAERIMYLDRSLDYNNMELRDYMEVARYMVVPGPDGTLLLRSLDQLSTAVKNQLPSRPELEEVDLDNDEQEETNRAIINSAIEDIMSQVGIESGLAESVLHSVIVPYTADLKTTTAYRKRASSLERNLQFIDSNKLPTLPIEIRRKEHDSNGRHPEIPAHMFCMGINSQAGFKARACAGNDNVIFLDPNVDTSAEQVSEMIKFARDNRMSFMFTLGDMDLVNEADDGVLQFASYTDTNSLIVPFFDLDINGYGETKSATFWLPEDVITWFVEDPDYRYDYADANIVGTKQFIDRINLADTGNEQFEVDTLFANVQEFFNGYELDYHVASADEINSIVWENLDLGISPANNNYEEVTAKTRMLLDEFFARWSGEHDYISTANQPDRVVGFACCTVRNPNDDDVYKYYAPIIPFQEHSGASRKAPSVFDAVLTYNSDLGAFDVAYRNTASMEGRYVKTHEEEAANKEVMLGEGVENAQFANGVEIDAFVWDETTGGRLVGDNKRIDTLQNLYMEMYTKGSGFGYNLALNEDGLPDNPELKAQLATGIVPFEEWEKYKSIRYSNDRRIDAFCKSMVVKCLKRGVNPSYFLANQYQVDGGDVVKSRMAFEFKTMMETTLQWQDEFMHFMHEMNPDLCPDGIEGEDEGCLYRVCKDSNWNYGCLMKWVPFPGSPDGGTWCIVRGNFGMFGEDNSAIKRPGFNGANIETQTLVINSHSGKSRPGTYNKYMKYALAGSIPKRLAATSGSTASVMVK